MKTISILMLVMSLSAVLMPMMVLAEETTASDVETSLDGSVSGAELSWKQLGLAFTFNQERKAEKELEIARLRLIQARVAAKNNNTEAVKKAIEAHNRILERVHARINAIDGKSDKQGIKNFVARFVALEKAIEVHEARIVKFNELLESEDLTDEQKAKIESQLELMQNKTDKLKELQETKRERVKTKLMAVTEMTEEEADAEIQELEDAENLQDVKKVVAEVKVQAAETALEKLKARVSQAEANGKNVSAIEAQIASAEQRIAEAKVLVSSENYSAALQTIKPVWNYGQNVKTIRDRIRTAEGKGNTVRTEIETETQGNSEDSDAGNEDSGSDNSASGSSNSGSGNN